MCRTQTPNCYVVIDTQECDQSLQWLMLVFSEGVFGLFCYMFFKEGLMSASLQMLQSVCLGVQEI